MSSTSTLAVSAPVYIPRHKRTSSSSSTSSSTHPLTYSRDELLSMAPSTSTSTPSSSPSSSFHDHSEHLEHTYAHPLGPSPDHPDAQGWLALNTAMRSYLRQACPEIVMNRKMRKAVEFASFQHRANSSASKREASSERRGTESKPKQGRAPSPLHESTNAPEEQDAETESTPAPTIVPSARSQSKRPPPRRTPSNRAPRTPRTANTRTRYNSFALFHRQLGGHGAGSEDSWRRPVEVTGL
ncbi:hypothetical protein FA13DRAFT_1739722 [Coprinellus micaceus]|uniref:Uncharacterized protein n=1 Tax=Coprinellus micaceus TaxID=71717 RepID=A0A4Y7SPE5_COPMI|nr:hypothetical protein FA13DRAFT_1739722 [Coprinellus micaceus]